MLLPEDLSSLVDRVLESGETRPSLGFRDAVNLI